MIPHDRYDCFKKSAHPRDAKKVSVTGVGRLPEWCFQATKDVRENVTKYHRINYFVLLPYAVPQ